MISVKPKRTGIIHWIYDPFGQNGKSTLCRLLELNDSKHVAHLEGLGTSRDVVETVIHKRKNGWTGRVLLINLSRSAGRYDFYNVLEQLSDGSMTRLKYNGGDIRYKAYYVIVFANWLPDYQQITPTRWNIKRIVGVGEYAELREVLIPGHFRPNSWN
jgi:hypothetical protein